MEKGARSLLLYSIKMKGFIFANQGKGSGWILRRDRSCQVIIGMPQVKRRPEGLNVRVGVVGEGRGYHFREQVAS
jgi:hypothetical protein